MSKDVYVLAEQRDGVIQKVGIELIGKATELAADLGQQVVAVLLGSGIKDKADTLIKHGANKVIVVDDPMLAEYVTEPYAKALYEVVKKCDPEIVLFGASSIGRDLLLVYQQECIQVLQPTVLNLISVQLMQCLIQNCYL